MSIIQKEEKRAQNEKQRDKQKQLNHRIKTKHTIFYTTKCKCHKNTDPKT